MWLRLLVIRVCQLVSRAADHRWPALLDARGAAAADVWLRRTGGESGGWDL